MYQQNILDHFKHPRNFGKIEGAENQAHVANPLCGDELDFFLEFNGDGNVSNVKFTGRGCAISIAAASMLTEKLKGLSRTAVEKFSHDQAVKLLGVPVNPARLKCATLALEAAQQALGRH